MKKDEIVVLSNEIEIINGVKVDWNKYKGRNTDKSRNAYIGLCELLNKNGHILESDYINNSTKVDINFNCGHKPHSIVPGAYKRGIGCPVCSGKSSEYAKEEFYKLVEKNNHIILGEYINIKTKILIDFNCGHKPHSITPDCYKNNQGCAMCKFEKGAKFKKEKSKEELYKLTDKNGHTILGEYKGAMKKILIDFNCGHKPHSITPSAYKRGDRCPICAGVSLKYAKEELYRIAEKSGHKILGEYINNRTEIEIDFNCGHEPHSITPRDYKRGIGCPKCKASKGEKEVSKILKEFNINYQEQHKFDDCICVRPLPFDFYISEFNLCIEYDGHFHYEPVRFRKKNETEYEIAKSQKIAEERLKETQRRDKIKTDYCRKNGIKLIRIPYWEFDNIESILKKELSKYIKAVA